MGRDTTLIAGQSVILKSASEGEKSAKKERTGARERERERERKERITIFTVLGSKQQRARAYAHTIDYAASREGN